MTSTSTGSATLRIMAPAEVLYDLVTDVARMGEWSPECVGADVPTSTPVIEGFTFTGHNRRGDQEWTAHCEVIAADRPRLFAFNAGDPDTPTTWTYEFRSVDATTTDVTESFDSAALRIPEVAAQLEGRRDQLVSDLSDTLATLKTVAERDNEQ